MSKIAVIEQGTRISFRTSTEKDGKKRDFWRIWVVGKLFMRHDQDRDTWFGMVELFPEESLQIPRPIGLPQNERLLFSELEGAIKAHQAVVQKKMMRR